MDVANRSPVATRWMLRRVEWILIAVYVLLGVMNGSFSLSISNSLSILAGIGVFILLSLFFPARHHHWVRQSYIASGILLVFIAWSQNLILDLFLYIYIAKSCFLLSRRAVIATVVVTGIGFVALDFWTLPKVLLEEPTLNFTLSEPHQIQQFLLSGLGTYLVCSTFTILFSYRVIAEQGSRQQAEALAQQVEQLATALERTRIARDIHDSLGHTLTSLQMQLVAAQRLRPHHLDQSFRATDTAKRLADQCIEDLSQALQTVRQSEQVDINQSLSTLLSQLKQHSRLTVEWSLSLPQLPLQTNHQLYCIVKEALNNVQKHACASQIYLQGQVISNEIFLELSDNGRGFDLTQLSSGFGLKGMRERVQMLGGQLMINSTPGSGTQIKITLPYD